MKLSLSIYIFLFSALAATQIAVNQINAVLNPSVTITESNIHFETPPTNNTIGLTIAACKYQMVYRNGIIQYGINPSITDTNSDFAYSADGLSAIYPPGVLAPKDNFKVICIK